MASADFDTDRAAAERQRIARELHDGLGQALYGISLSVRTARELLPAQPDRAAEALDHALDLAQRGAAELRALILGLKVEALSSDELIDMMRRRAGEICALHSLTLRFDCTHALPIPEALREPVLKIALEAVHNAARHAHAREVAVRIDAMIVDGEQRIELTIADDGRGFDPQADVPGHFGLHVMRRRTRECGGTLDIDSTPGAGTRIRASLPVVTR